MTTKTLTIEQVLTLLAEAPTRISALSTDLSPAQLHTPPSPDEWSVNDVLAHLRSCSDMWGSSIARILVEDKPTFKAVNPRTWIKQTDYPDLEFRASLQAYSAQRADLLSALEPLPHEGWSREATVLGAGKPLTRTVFTYAESLVVHERPHLKQIARIVKAMQA
jgi:hypothetical protein